METTTYGQVGLIQAIRWEPRMYYRKDGTGTLSVKGGLRITAVGSCTTLQRPQEVCCVFFF